MALVSGPGRGGDSGVDHSSGKIDLVIEKHVKYIQDLDTVRG